MNIVLVGLAFGGSFAEIYKCHPDVKSIGIFDIDINQTKLIAEKFGIDKIYNSFEEILQDDKVDAVHLVTPIPQHAEQSVAVLSAGKHCACTVPMATSLEDIQAITNAVRRSGKNYMMMETGLYTYQFFYIQDMIKSGELGRIQFLRGSHYQDMQNWPSYWMGLPPMYYGTHAIGPMTALSQSRIKRVIGFGSGVMDEALTKQYNNPYPIETAFFEFENGLKGEATRSLFATAREYQEGLFVYGSKASFEWGLSDLVPPYVSHMFDTVEGRRGARCEAKITPMPNFHARLPLEIQRFTVGDSYDPLNPQDSLQKGAGGGHHGSHPHLVHEFISSIKENRKPWIDEVLGGNITAAGICAHLSAMKNGEPVIVPEF